MFFNWLKLLNIKLFRGVVDDDQGGSDDLGDGSDFGEDLGLPLDGLSNEEPKGLEDDDGKAPQEPADLDPDNEPEPRNEPEPATPAPQATKEPQPAAQPPKPAANEPPPREELEKLPVEELVRRIRGITYDSKRDRQALQALKAERDHLLTQRRYAGGDQQPPAAAAAGTPPANPAGAIPSPFEGKDPEDYPTYGELQEYFKALRTQPPAAPAATPPAGPAPAVNQPPAGPAPEEEARRARIDALEEAFTEMHPDYPQAVNLAAELMQQDQELAVAVAIAANNPDRDPVALTYKIAQMHPKFKDIQGQPARKDPPRRQDPNGNGDVPPRDLNRAIVNGSRKKVSANLPSSSGGPSATDLEGMDTEELGRTLANMPISQYMKIPKNIREKALTG